MFSDGFAGFWGQPQGIDICAEFDDVFFFQIVVAADLFYITSVKNGFGIHFLSPRIFIFFRKKFTSSIHQNPGQRKAG